MVELTRKTTVTAKQVLSYLKGSKDPNDELHKKFAIGIQLEQLALTFGNEYTDSINPDLRCVQIQAKFDSPVPVNSEITLKIIEGKKDVREATPTIDVLVGEQRALTASLQYSVPEQTSNIVNARGNAYHLGKRPARKIATGLNVTREKLVDADYGALAMSLVSKALYESNKKLIQQKMKDGKAPTYFAHTFIFTPAFYQIAKDTELCMSANAEPIGAPAKEKYCADVTAVQVTSKQPSGRMDSGKVHGQGQVVYTARLMIKYVNPSALMTEQVLANAQQPKATPNS